MTVSIVFVMNGWRSAAGGIQTFNRELAQAVASHASRPRVVCVATSVSDEERTDAAARDVELISGESELGLVFTRARAKLSELRGVRAVIGHSTFSGHHARLLRDSFYPDARLVHCVHTTPFETEELKEYRSESYVQQRVDRMNAELELASQADLVVCVGPRIRAHMEKAFARKGEGGRRKLLELVCGFKDRRAERVGTSTASVLFVGRCDSIAAKGIDILAHAAGAVQAKWLATERLKTVPAPEFTVRGAKDSPEKLDDSLNAIAAEAGGRRGVIKVTPYTSIVSEIDADYRSSSVFVMPSRGEGFGLVACEALSFGLPIIISRASGLADVLVDLHTKENFDTTKFLFAGNFRKERLAEDGAALADSIFATLDSLTEREAHASLLLTRLLDKYSWDHAADRLLTALKIAEPDQGSPPQPSDPLSTPPERSSVARPTRDVALEYSNGLSRRHEVARAAVQFLHRRWFPGAGARLDRGYRVSMYVLDATSSTWDCVARSVGLDLGRSWRHETDEEHVETAGLLVWTVVDGTNQRVPGVPVAHRADQGELDRYCAQVKLSAADAAGRSWPWASVAVAFGRGSRGLVSCAVCIERQDGGDLAPRVPSWSDEAELVMGLLADAWRQL